ncbi:MAG TPA: response regulator [Cytophagales bacterium]|nr:response regulator [Cytophagales bacterium]
MFYFNCILLIDDDPTSNIVTEELLKQLYFSDRIVSVLNAEDALNFIKDFYQEKQGLPELILIDINMPGTDGFKFVETLNALPFIDKDTFRISALTSSSDSRDRHLMEKLGVDHYIVKPLNAKKVRDMLSAIN